MHNRRGQLCEEHCCADIYRFPREFRDGPRWHYLLQHTDEYSPHTCNPRQRRRRRHPSLDKKAQAKWRELYPDTEPAGLFVAKVDVSEIPVDELQASFPAFERLLLDRLCASEGFCEQGGLASAMRTDVPTILANTSSVGDHVCTWVRTSKAGYTVRTKAYNKVVSNFEAGEIRKPIGGHLADYVDCPNEHLRHTFLHPDVQAQGCTRIEVSLYACRGGDLSAYTAKEVVAEALALVSPSDLPEEKRSVCGPAASQAVGEPVLDVMVRPTKANADKREACERAIEWAAADFGFRACPIFRVDILGANEEGVELGPLRCFTKDADAGTLGS